MVMVAWQPTRDKEIEKSGERKEYYVIVILSHKNIRCNFNKAFLNVKNQYVFTFVITYFQYAERKTNEHQQPASLWCRYKTAVAKLSTLRGVRCTFLSHFVKYSLYRNAFFFFQMNLVEPIFHVAYKMLVR
jgi:hypothetical protein